MKSKGVPQPPNSESNVPTLDDSARGAGAGTPKLSARESFEQWARDVCVQLFGRHSTYFVPLNHNRWPFGESPAAKGSVGEYLLEAYKMGQAASSVKPPSKDSAGVSPGSASRGNTAETRHRPQERGIAAEALRADKYQQLDRIHTNLWKKELDAKELLEEQLLDAQEKLAKVGEQIAEAARLIVSSEPFMSAEKFLDEYAEPLRIRDGEHKRQIAKFAEAYAEEFSNSLRRESSPSGPFMSAEEFWDAKEGRPPGTRMVAIEFAEAYVEYRRKY